MAYALTDDGIEIYYEAKGQGLPIVFCFRLFWHQRYLAGTDRRVVPDIPHGLL